MARIKIDFPEKILARVQVPVRITDMNYGNHLGNDALVSLIHEARVKWLTQLGYSELEAGGAGLIMSDLAVTYSNESFYGDVLDISLAAGEISRAGFEFFYLIETTRNGTIIPVAKAKTGMVCYDYANKKVVSLPETLKNNLLQ